VFTRATADHVQAPAVEAKPAVVLGKTKSGRVTKTKAAPADKKKAAPKKAAAKKAAPKKTATPAKKETTA
jgi:histone H1/5